MFGGLWDGVGTRQSVNFGRKSGENLLTLPLPFFYRLRFIGPSDHAGEGLPVDVKYTRGRLLIASSTFKDPPDVIGLHLGQRYETILRRMWPIAL
jgi:hypothetical protein